MHDKNFLKQQSTGKSEISLQEYGTAVLECKTYSKSSKNKNCQLLLAKCNGLAKPLSITGPRSGSNSCLDFFRQ